MGSVAMDDSGNIIFDRVALCLAVDRQPETLGMGVAVVADGQVTRVRLTRDMPDVMFDVRARTGTDRSERPTPTAAVSPTVEWISWGMSCGGMVLSWVGVAGTAAIAPETGGASLAMTTLLWGGAVASTGQCTSSLYRVGNLMRGREDINAALDKNKLYNWSMAAPTSSAWSLPAEH